MAKPKTYAVKLTAGQLEAVARLLAEVQYGTTEAASRFRVQCDAGKAHADLDAALSLINNARPSNLVALLKQSIAEARS